MEKAPCTQLANGIRIANFSSPHPFNFITGEVLPACSPERANALMLESEEVETAVARDNGVFWTDIDLQWSVSDQVRGELIELAAQEDVDVILVPFPVMTAVKAHLAEGSFADRRLFPAMKKMRVVRTADRVTKAIYSDRFCR